MIGTVYLENSHSDAATTTTVKHRQGANVFIRKSDSNLVTSCRDPTYFAEFRNHCGYSIDDGGWELVRHAPKGATWHTATDKLNGSNEYGDSSEGPEGSSPWSIKFEDTLPDYDELLLSSGNCKHWMIIDKENIHFGNTILTFKKNLICIQLSEDQK